MKKNQQKNTKKTPKHIHDNDDKAEDIEEDDDFDEDVLLTEDGNIVEDTEPVTEEKILADDVKSMSINLEPDTDGVPLVPQEIIPNILAAYIQPAFNRSKYWHEPKPSEKQNITNLILAFKEQRTADMLVLADKLDLNMYRCKTEATDKKPLDSYLILFTKVGVRDYSGPFLFLREQIAKPSKVIMIVPHNGSDGTNKDSVVGFQNCRALAMVCNGHNKGITPEADFADHMNTLGAITLRNLCNNFPKSVYFHIHGSRKKRMCMYRCREKVMGKSFEKGILSCTNVDKFQPFNAYYPIDKIPDSGFYLKTEIPARIHLANQMVLANVIKEFETNAWAHN